MTLLDYNPIEIISQFDKKNLLPVYFKLLLNENKKINLVSRETILDSSINSGGIPQNLVELAAESLLPLINVKLVDNPTYLDIGSGGGFPSIPIILTHSLSKAVLVERTQKKAGALRRILLEFKKRADIYPISFENFKSEPESFDLITLRLVKLGQQMSSQIFSLLKPNGIFIYYSSSNINFDNNKYSKEELSYHANDNPPITYTIFRRL